MVSPRSSFRENSQGFVVRLLAVVACTGVAAYVAQVWKTHQVVVQFHPVPSLDSWRQVAARDPKIGESLASFKLRDINNKEIRISGLNKPFGVLFIEECATCAASDSVHPWNLLQIAHPNASLMVATKNPIQNQADIRKYLRDNRLSVQFIGQGHESLERFCNTFFRPRVALFDGQGRLNYLQPPSVSSEAAIKVVSGALRRWNKEAS